jgi:hypothetical protein
MLKALLSKTELLNKIMLKALLSNTSKTELLNKIILNQNQLKFYLLKLSTKSGPSAVGEVEQIERISESE